MKIRKTHLIGLLVCVAVFGPATASQASNVSYDGTHYGLNSGSMDAEFYVAWSSSFWELASIYPLEVGVRGADLVDDTGGVRCIDPFAGEATLACIDTSSRLIEVNAGAGDDGLNLYVADRTVAFNAEMGSGDDWVDLTTTSYSGNDTIDPGSGNDTVRTGNGNDKVNADDGERDTIYCGNGTDRVSADAIDKVDSNCETVVISLPGR